MTAKIVFLGNGAGGATKKSILFCGMIPLVYIFTVLQVYVFMVMALTA